MSGKDKEGEGTASSKCGSSTKRGGGESGGQSFPFLNWFASFWINQKDLTRCLGWIPLLSASILTCLKRGTDEGGVAAVSSVCNWKAATPSGIRLSRKKAPGCPVPGTPGDRTESEPARRSQQVQD